MAFITRTYEQILTDMISYVQANTVLSDFTVGSVIRTILEAAAEEDSEQYFQMVQLLDAFSITNALGQDLDDRLAEFNINRFQAAPAIAWVRFFDSYLITDQCALDAVVGAVTVQAFSTTRFPTSYPYNIRIGESTTHVQDVTVTNNNTSTATLTLSTPLINDIFVGDRVSFITPGASPKLVNTGTLIQVAPSVGNPARVFTTEEPAAILTGNYYSNEVVARCTISGVAGNVGSTTISQFFTNPPFPGIGVTNPEPAGSGRSRESDDDFRIRGLNLIQSLSRGTPLAIKTGALGVTDPATGQRVVSDSLLEDFTAREITLYIDDGTGLVPDIQNIPSSSLTTAALIGGSTLALSTATEFPSAGFVLVNEDGSSNPAELVGYTNKVGNSLVLSSTLTQNHDINTIVDFVDIIDTNTENGRRRFNLSNFPVVRSTDRIFLQSGSSWTELAPETDYILNRGTGEFQFTSLGGVALGSVIVANYDYYTNLIKNVQRVLEGDPADPVNYPGYKAAGIFLNVEAPSLRRISVICTISAQRGFSEIDIAPQVQERISNYIRSLGVGEDVVRSKMIDVAFNVPGLKDIIISFPTTNIVILDNELAVPFDVNGVSTVSVS